jgi:hypothetical protein
MSFTEVMDSELEGKTRSEPSYTQRGRSHRLRVKVGPLGECEDRASPSVIFCFENKPE